jgi:hypothetical protein
MKPRYRAGDGAPGAAHGVECGEPVKQCDDDLHAVPFEIGSTYRPRVIPTSPRTRGRVLGDPLLHVAQRHPLRDLGGQLRAELSLVPRRSRNTTSRT